MTKVYNGTNPFKVGDILHHQYRYTASFPEFFKVTKITQKCVWVIRLGSIMVVNGDGYGQSGMKMPDIYDTWGKEKKCSIRHSYHGVGALVDSRLESVATLWDGKPKEFYGD